MHAFQNQESQQTLAQGLEEYFAVYPGLANRRLMSAEAREFFLCHDVVHVVYGCDVALADEAVAKIASLLGTTAGIRVLKGYRLHESTPWPWAMHQQYMGSPLHELRRTFGIKVAHCRAKNEA